ncbi:MAG: hypothetical protein H7840_14105 [Alphaproteobacteria bacterium]
MKTTRFLIGALALMFFGYGSQALAVDPPVATLMQVQGQVEFSKDGQAWSPVTRNKMLFVGDMVRTGADGSGKIINQTNNTSQTIAADSVIKAAAEGPQAVSGKLSAPESVSGDLVAGLGNRFAAAQKYTTVRRAAKTDGSAISISAAPSLRLSATYPDLVWENVGKQYTYALAIDGKSVTVPATSEPIVRHRLAGIEPGTHKFSITVMEGDKTVAKTDKDSEIIWLSSAEDTAVKEAEQRLKTVAPGDDFVMANFLDEKGLVVAAMDSYRRYFEKNRDDNDMRPLLIKVYNDLKLKDLKSAEAETYNNMLNK